MTDTERVDLDVAQARLDVKRQRQGIAPIRRVLPHVVAPLAEMRSETQSGAPKIEADVEIDALIDGTNAKPDYNATLVPDGARIVAALIDVQTGNVAANAPKWFARFRIIEAPVPVPEMSIIIRSYNPPRFHLYVSPRHSLARDFLNVCGMPLRSYPANASPRAILGSFLKDVFVNATTAQVTGYHDARTRTRVERPTSAWYSVICSIDGIAAGSPAMPRFLARRRKR